jgi:hypothetical protein
MNLAENAQGGPMLMAGDMCGLHERPSCRTIVHRGHAYLPEVFPAAVHGRPAWCRPGYPASVQARCGPFHIHERLPCPEVDFAFTNTLEHGHCFARCQDLRLKRGRAGVDIADGRGS